MPFGRVKKQKAPAQTAGGAPDKAMNDKSNGSAAGAEQGTGGSAPRSKLVFHCQQAHGSPTGIISGFSNVKELYARIADAYDMEASEVGRANTPVFVLI